MSEEIIIKAFGGSGTASIPFADEDGPSRSPRRSQSRVPGKDEPFEGGPLRGRVQQSLGSFRSSTVKGNLEVNSPSKRQQGSSSEVSFPSKETSQFRQYLKTSRADVCAPEVLDNPLRRYENALLKYQKPGKLRPRREVSRDSSHGYSSSDDSVVRNKSKSTSSIDAQSLNNILDEYEDLDCGRSSDLSDAGSITVTNFEAVMDLQRKREASKLRSSPGKSASTHQEERPRATKANQQTQVRQRSRDRAQKDPNQVEDGPRPPGIASSFVKKLENEPLHSRPNKVPDSLLRKGEVQKRVDEWLSQTQSQNFSKEKVILVRSNSNAEQRCRSGARIRSMDDGKEWTNGTTSYDDLRKEEPKQERKVERVSVGVNTGTRGTYKEYLAARNRYAKDYGFAATGSSVAPRTRDPSPGSRIPQRGHSANSSFRSKRSETGEASEENVANSPGRFKAAEAKVAARPRPDPEPGRPVAPSVSVRRSSLRPAQVSGQAPLGTFARDEVPARGRPGPKGSPSSGNRVTEEPAAPNKDGESGRAPLPSEVTRAGSVGKGDPARGPPETIRTSVDTSEKAGPEEARSQDHLRAPPGPVVSRRETAATDPLAKVENAYGPVGSRLRVLQGHVDPRDASRGPRSTTNPVDSARKIPVPSRGPVVPPKNEPTPTSAFKPNNAMYATLYQSEAASNLGTNAVSVANESVTRSHYAAPKHVEKIYERTQPQVMRLDEDEDPIRRSGGRPPVYGDGSCLGQDRLPETPGTRRQEEDIYERIPDARCDHLETIVEDQRDESGDILRYPEIGPDQCLRFQRLPNLPNGRTKDSTPKETIYARPWDRPRISKDQSNTFGVLRGSLEEPREEGTRPPQGQGCRSSSSCGSGTKIGEMDHVVLEDADLGSSPCSHSREGSNLSNSNLEASERSEARFLDEGTKGKSWGTEAPNLEDLRVKEREVAEPSRHGDRAPVVKEVLVKTLQFDQDVPEKPKTEPALLAERTNAKVPFNFHSVLSDDYPNPMRLDRENKVYVTREEMERQKMMDLLKKGDYEAVKAELERSYTLSTPGGSSPTCYPPCSPPPAPAAYISSARASSRRLGSGPPSPERDPLGRLLRFLKTFYRELGTRDPPHLPPWTAPLPLGSLCPAHFQPHLQLVHRSEQEHRLENIKPDQIFAPVR
ncbi:uncharacterized protein LOC105697095, partial [Orussus abietinus]|uniref:uncharacterized protein LOC105697095 n=1 Tax=Orussus abietinus TaxID=222816 RepID=UPI000C715BC1